MSDQIQGEQRGENVYAQWFVFLAGPIIWSHQLLLSYFVITVFCGIWSTSVVALSLHVISGVATVVTLVALGLAYRLLKRNRAANQNAVDEPEDRSTFMGASGLLLSGLFLIVIVGSWLGVFFLSPC